MQVIGHRGAAARAPENTWAGFDKAIEIGVDAIETDIQKTKDGHLVLFHDDTIERTTNGAGTIQQHTLEELLKLDAGSHFSQQYAGATIPLLNHTLEKYHQTPWVLEIKQPMLGLEIMELVTNLNLQDSTTITSFDFDSVAQVKQNYPDIKTGYLSFDSNQQTIIKTKAANIDQFCPEAKTISRNLVEQLQSQGFQVRAWGVGTQDLMHQVIDSQAWGMTIDFPNKLLKVLGRNL